MRSPLTAPERLARIDGNIRRFHHLPRLARGFDNDLSVAICGFGPSLADTWNDVRKCDQVITTSGAHDFLISRGVIPHIHVECDPRERKVKFVRNSHPNVTYLINSQCHPSMFDELEGRRVVMWHGFTDDDAGNQVALVDSLEPGAPLLGGGTNVGMRAITVARQIGYRRFELHGMDCCYRDEEQWAGEHFTKKQYPRRVEVEGRIFETSDQMLQSTDDFFNTMNMLGGCSFKIYGDGLLEARMQMFMKDHSKAFNQGWWHPVGVVNVLPERHRLGLYHTLRAA